MPETITNKNLPPSQQAAGTVAPVPEVQIPYGEIVAKPLRSPNFINLVPKNPNMSLYWGNRAVGEKESGLRYDQLIAMGFVPAKPDQILTQSRQPCPPSLLRDGRVMYGDLILLIIPRADYIGAQKWNAENAVNRVRRLGQSMDVKHTATGEDEARANPQSVLGNLNRSQAAREGKIGVYVPKLAETDSKTTDNTGGQKNLAET